MTGAGEAGVPGVARAATAAMCMVAAAWSVAALSCGPKDHSAPGLYQAYCARCHLASGKGDPRSIPLYPNLDLTTSQLVRLRARGDLYRRIAEGFGPMPGFSHRLDQQEIESLVEYTLRFQPPKPAQKAGS